VKLTKIALAFGVAVAASMQPAAAQSGAAAAPDAWTWRANIYAWFPNVKSAANFPIPGGGATIDIDADPDGYLSKLQFAFMGSLEARKGDWSIFGDVVTFDFGNTRSNVTSVSVGGVSMPLPTSVNLSADFSGTVAELGAGYSIVRTTTDTVDVIAGVRYLRLKAGLDWSLAAAPPGIPLAGHSERTRDFWDGVVGIRGRSDFAERWYVSYYADIGAGSSERTWQAFAGVGYHFGWGDVLAGYRYLTYEFDDAKPVADIRFGGPLVGVGFRF
jgi:hypothetical protein